METWITMHEDLRNSPRCRASFDALVEGLQRHVARKRTLACSLRGLPLHTQLTDSDHRRFCDLKASRALGLDPCHDQPPGSAYPLPFRLLIFSPALTRSQQLCVASTRRDE